MASDYEIGRQAIIAEIKAALDNIENSTMNRKEVWYKVFQYIRYITKSEEIGK